MRKLFLLFAGAALFITTACDKFPPIPPVDPGPDPRPEYCEPVTASVTTGIAPGGCVVGYSIQKAWVEGDYLKIYTTYSGCGLHEFDLDWDANYTPAGLTLLDLTGPEMCDAYFEHELCFDLTKMRTAEHGEVKLNLNGYAGSELVYTY